MESSQLLSSIVPSSSINTLSQMSSTLTKLVTITQTITDTVTVTASIPSNNDISINQQALVISTSSTNQPNNMEGLGNDYF